jgi:hypothetical protein
LVPPDTPRVCEAWADGKETVHGAGTTGRRGGAQWHNFAFPPTSRSSGRRQPPIGSRSPAWCAPRLNPTGLDWRRFLVDQDDGKIVGVGQVKLHGDGNRELASLAVVSRRQGRCVGAVIVRALLAREAGPNFLYCAQGLVGYYERFGFRPVGPRETTPYLRRVRLVANALFRLIGLVRRDVPRLIVMKRDGCDALRAGG